MRIYNIVSANLPLDRGSLVQQPQCLLGLGRDGSVLFVSVLLGVEDPHYAVGEAHQDKRLGAGLLGLLELGLNPRAHHEQYVSRGHRESSSLLAH